MTHSVQAVQSVSSGSFHIDISLCMCVFVLADSSQIIYDSVEMSPNYDNTPNDLYIDERELIELPQPGQGEQNQINEPYQKRYVFNAMNLPYNLEQPSSYSTRQPMPGEKNKSNESRGPRLNRYYENLKPYYKLKEPTSEDKTLVFES